jgi:drug/metabolite transporter superfamily protein YnfA
VQYTFPFLPKPDVGFSSLLMLNLRLDVKLAKMVICGCINAVTNSYLKQQVIFFCKILGEGKLRILESKKSAVVAIAILAFSMMTSVMLAPAANAHYPAWEIPTHAYINVAPNPVGVGQRVLVIMWIDRVFGPDAGLGNNWRFHGYELTITNPNGTSTKQNFGEIADPTSSQPTYFTPDQAGTWTFNFTFPGQKYTQYAGAYNPNSILVNDTFLASSASTTLTVQEEKVPILGPTPLPTEYWTRPIYGENPSWFVISSNWLGTGSPVEACVDSGVIGAYGANSLFSGAALNRYPGDAIGPLTSHVMWTKPLQQGGVVGGDNFIVQGDTYFEGSAYCQRYDNPIIMDGILYYQAPIGYDYPATGGGGTGQGDGTYAVNLQTGQQLWESDVIPAGQLSFGYIYDAQNPNQKGVMQPVLFTSNFGQAYDAYTGIYLFNVTNVPGGVVTMGPMGEHIKYVVSNDYLAEWNSSGIWNWNIIVGGGAPNPAVSNFNLTTTSYDFATGTFVTRTVAYYNTVNGNTPQCYDWNVSLPSTVPSSFTQVAAFYGNMLLCMNGSLSGLGIDVLSGVVSHDKPYTYFAINLNESRPGYKLGDLLWMHNVDPAPNNVTVLLGPADPSTGVFTEGYKETMQWVGYSLVNGSRLWGPTASQASLDYFGNPITPLIQAQLAYGKLYSSGYAGILYCYDLKNGSLLWTYGNGGPGNSTRSTNSPFGDYPTFINAVGNGIIYLVSSEHTVSTPIYKGAKARAVNATDGSEIWTISGYTGEFASMSYAIADGYATWFNGYDNQIYVVGRGPSATTASAPDVSVAYGTPVVIKGTVIDISAGTKQDEQVGRFPNGVPVISDANMGDWMGYVYQQQPIPADAVGVNVTISVLDPNNNMYDVATATSDTSGFYSATFVPQVPGRYTVIVSFAGTNGYWPSHAETALNVLQEVPPTAPPTAPPASLADIYLLPISIAILVVIIVAAIVIVLMLRRR